MGAELILTGDDAVCAATGDIIPEGHTTWFEDGIAYISEGAAKLHAVLARVEGERDELRKLHDRALEVANKVISERDELRELLRLSGQHTIVDGVPRMENGRPTTDWLLGTIYERERLEAKHYHLLTEIRDRMGDLTIWYEGADRDAGIVLAIAEEILSSTKGESDG